MHFRLGIVSLLKNDADLKDSSCTSDSELYLSKNDADLKDSSCTSMADSKSASDLPNGILIQKTQNAADLDSDLKSFHALHTQNQTSFPADPRLNAPCSTVTVQLAPYQAGNGWHFAELSRRVRDRESILHNYRATIWDSAECECDQKENLFLVKMKEKKRLKMQSLPKVLRSQAM